MLKVWKILLNFACYFTKYYLMENYFTKYYLMENYFTKYYSTYVESKENLARFCVLLHEVLLNGELLHEVLLNGELPHEVLLHVC